MQPHPSCQIWLLSEPRFPDDREEVILIPDNWLNDETPEMREAAELAQRVSTIGDCHVPGNGYAHDCKEPDTFGLVQCCIEAGSEIQINPALWQQMEATARAMGTTVSKLWDVPADWNQDDDTKLSKKWKKPR